jgi:hypothetical protein
MESKKTLKNFSSACSITLLSHVSTIPSRFKDLCWSTNTRLQSSRCLDSRHAVKCSAKPVGINQTHSMKTVLWHSKFLEGRISSRWMIVWKCMWKLIDFVETTSTIVMAAKRRWMLWNQHQSTLYQESWSSTLCDTHLAKRTNKLYNTLRAWT